jgi:hypothetical protein
VFPRLKGLIPAVLATAATLECPPCAATCCAVVLCQGTDACGELEPKVCAAADETCPLFESPGRVGRDEGS